MNFLGARNAQTDTGNAANYLDEQMVLGQRQFVGSEVLPARINFPYDDKEKKLAKKRLEAAGFKFGQVVDGDPLFQEAQLPAGWKKVATGQDLWSKIVDDKGCERIMVFYNAAFHDRDAFMNIHEVA